MTNVVPIQQRLYLSNIELRDNLATLEQAGIFAHDTLILRIPNQSQEQCVRNDFDDEASYQAFGGTLLSGSSINNETTEEMAGGINCPVCTYFNAVDLRRCEVCATVLK